MCLTLRPLRKIISNQSWGESDFFVQLCIHSNACKKSPCQNQNTLKAQSALSGNDVTIIIGSDDKMQWQNAKLCNL